MVFGTHYLQQLEDIGEAIETYEAVVGNWDTLLLHECKDGCVPADKAEKVQVICSQLVALEKVFNQIDIPVVGEPVLPWIEKRRKLALKNGPLAMHINRALDLEEFCAKASLRDFLFSDTESSENVAIVGSADQVDSDQQRSQDISVSSTVIAAPGTTTI